MKRLRYENSEIDRIDGKLLKALAENSRISTANLARMVGLSAPSVSERIKRLEESGVIESYTIKINPEGLGLPLTVWLRIRPLPGQLKKVAELIHSLSEIVECDRITGDDCFIARANVKSVIEMERLIDSIIPYATTNTAIAQSSPVASRLPKIG